MGWGAGSFELLDNWSGNWATQYDAKAQAAVTASLQEYRGSCRSEESASVLECMMEMARVESVHEAAASLFTGRNVNILGLYRLLETDFPFRTSTYNAAATPFLRAALPMVQFSMITEKLLREVNDVQFQDLNRLFNFVYGNLEGYLRTERAVQRTYANAILLTDHYDPLVHSDAAFNREYCELIADTHCLIAERVFAGIQRYPADTIDGKLVLPANGREYILKFSD